MRHDLKLNEHFAEAVRDGKKNFEVRRNDRGFQKGDFVKFTVVADDGGLPIVPNPLEGMEFVITYVLSGWGISEGYVVFGMKKASASLLPPELAKDIAKDVSEYLQKMEKGRYR